MRVAAVSNRTAIDASTPDCLELIMGDHFLTSPTQIEIVPEKTNPESSIASSNRRTIDQIAARLWVPFLRR